jgi:FtsH-binding integral membrane protein
MLAHYGPEAKDARDLLHGFVINSLNRVWPQEEGQASGRPQSTDAEAFADSVQALLPKDDTQRALKAQAINMAIALGQTRWLMVAQQTTSVSKPFLVVLVFWLAALFISFGLYAPRNTTVTTAFFFAALSVSGAIFLILEMYTPYTGIIHISSATLRSALGHLGQ